MRLKTDKLPFIVQLQRLPLEGKLSPKAALRNRFW